jgi:hypothetical protein
MKMTRHRLQQIEASMIAVGGLWLLVEVTSAVRSNVWWIDASVFTMPRFSVYLWAAVGLALSFVIEGAVAISQSRVNISFIALRGPLAVLMVSLLIVIARGWRIRTDVGPENAISSYSDLPIAVRILADPWLTGLLVGLVAVLGAWLMVRALSGEGVAFKRG